CLRRPVQALECTSRLVVGRRIFGCHLQQLREAAHRSLVVPLTDVLHGQHVMQLRICRLLGQEGLDLLQALHRSTSFVPCSSSFSNSYSSSYRTIVTIGPFPPFSTRGG